ncbi:30S ribosomal protein S7 [Candidatus Woesearchaeota archaeon]|nr:MAG: 30S ribosomal protein S7 [Candidatus Woesearchaeota archaeon]
MSGKPKVFGKWDVEGIKVEDKGLVKYINLEPKIVPKSFARYACKRFYKNKAFIVERLINKLMVSGHKGKKHFKTSYKFTGKWLNAYKIVEEAFEIIAKKTGENPMKIFVKALENAAPRDEVIAIEYGGARYPKAVDCSPQRRVDLALRHIAQGAYHKCFNTKIGIAESLANEIIAAYECSPQSNAITKKYELERQADASR